MSKIRSLLALTATALAVAVIPAAAQADTATIGQQTLTPAAFSVFPSAITAPGAPVFQGDASGNYVLTSPFAGTITSFSFLTAGSTPGTQYQLVVLHPNDATQTNWTVTGASSPVAVPATAAGGTDSVAGPFAAGVAIGAGDRIGIESVSTSSQPVETTGNPGDGFRDFSAAVPVGSSANVSPGSTMDNGQVVPVQATVTSTPPTAVTNTSPPAVTGTPEAGQTLTCAPGTWTGSPTFTYAWFQTTATLVPGAKPPKVNQTTTRVATGPTYVMPDLPLGVELSCSVVASGAGGAAAATSPLVEVQASVPALAPPLRYRLRAEPNKPRVVGHVGFGQTDTCSPGTWLHFPKSFLFRWYLIHPKTRTRRATPVLIGHAQKLKIGQADELHQIFCRVTAANVAGSASADSADTFVPKEAPKPETGVGIQVNDPTPVRDDPATSAGSPLLEGPDHHFTFSCLAPRYNRHVNSVSYSWNISLFAFGLAPNGAVSPNVFDPRFSVAGKTLDISPAVESNQDGLAVTRVTQIDGTPPPSGIFSTPQIAVQCAVTAKLTADVYSVTNSKPFYLLATPVTQ